MRLILAIVIAASVTPALAADLSASDVRGLLSMVGVNPGSSREVNGGRMTIKSVRVSRHGRGDFVIRIRIDESPNRQAGP
jgi:hypothetical protein